MLVAVAPMTGCDRADPETVLPCKPTTAVEELQRILLHDDSAIRRVPCGTTQALPIGRLYECATASMSS